MTKVMVIGHFNSIIKNIQEVFEEYYQTQICPDNPDVLKGMLEMSKPDLILLCVIDIKDGMDIFRILEKMVPVRPVICLGTSDELEPYEEIIQENQFRQMIRPVKMRNITKRISQILHLPDEEMEEDVSERYRKRRILLIDDSGIQLRMMREILKGKYDVDMAESGKEALHMIKRQEPDLILLDYDMPGLDGKETLEMIRKNEFSQDTPVIFLTGVRDKKKIEAALELNPDGYILKPVSQEKILETIWEYLHA